MFTFGESNRVGAHISGISENFSEGNMRIPAGCAISAIANVKGIPFSGKAIRDSIANMRERSNGLGGGFAAYGIYPEYKGFYAFHIFYEGCAAQENTECFLGENFDIEVGGKIPTRKVVGITDAPLIWRYFLAPRVDKLAESELNADEFVMRCVMRVNSSIDGAYIASSGKNMGVFKAVGYPEDVADFYMIDTYKAYIWTAHGRFPTNTPGWWGGAHPFALLDWTVVHNGEISSYGANVRFLEMFGYKCTLQTDTEAITYIFDHLVRRHGLSFEVAVATVAAPFWDDIERMLPEKRELIKALRATYASLLINGPFSIILAWGNGLMALNDRIKLRSLVSAQHGDNIYIASEEAAIRTVCPEATNVRSLGGGEPLLVFIEGIDGYGN